MNRSESVREYIIALIGKILVQNPEATNREILKFLERNGFNGLTENTVGKYTKKANAFRIVRVRRQTVELANVEYTGHLREALMGAWNIARDTGTNPLIKLAAYNTIGKLAKQLRDMFLEAKSLEKSPESSAIPSDAAANLRALAPLPPDLREQRDRWLQTQGMLDVPQLTVPADAIAAEVEAEAPNNQRNEEEEKRRAEEAQQKEKERQERKEEIRRKETQEKERYEAGVRELGPEVMEKAKAWPWPTAALDVPLDIRIIKLRETWGKGRVSEQWDNNWQYHFGSIAPPF
jgi:hypothetical protein